MYERNGIAATAEVRVEAGEVICFRMESDCPEDAEPSGAEARVYRP